VSLEGMDVDEAQRLAQRLDANAQALGRIAAALTALTAELGQSWQGPAAAVFQHQWAGQYRAALTGAAQAMADLHGHLTANIAQQLQASAAQKSGTGGGPSGHSAAALSGLAITAMLGGIRGAWRAVETADGYVSLVTEPADWIEKLAGNDYVAGRYTQAWSRLIQLDHGGPLLRYKSSPIFQWLHDSPQVRDADALMERTHATTLLGKLDKVGTGLGVLSLSVSGGEAAADLGQHHYASAGGHLVDGTAGALEVWGGPAGKLAGFDISLIKKDVELGRQVQWSQGIPNPFGPGVFKNDYVPVFKELPGQLVSTLAGIF